MKQSVSQIVYVSVIAVVVGIAAGIVGAVVSENYLCE